MSSSESHSSSAHPEEKLQYPRRSQSRRSGHWPMPCSQDLVKEITLSDPLRGLPAWPEIRMKEQGRKSYKNKPHLVKVSQCLREHSFGAARPWRRQNWLLLSPGLSLPASSPLHPPTAMLRLSLLLFSGHFMASHTSPDLNPFCKKNQLFTISKASA